MLLAYTWFNIFLINTHRSQYFTLFAIYYHFYRSYKKKNIFLFRVMIHAIWVYYHSFKKKLVKLIWKTIDVCIIILVWNCHYTYLFNHLSINLLFIDNHCQKLKKSICNSKANWSFRNILYYFFIYYMSIRSITYYNIISRWHRYLIKN